MNNKLKICVIEDNELLMIAIKDFFKAKGFSIHTACSDITQQCRIFTGNHDERCPKKDPCRNLLVIDNRQVFSSGIKFLEYIYNIKCPCSGSFKVLYTADTIPGDRMERLRTFGVMLVKKTTNHRDDLFPVVKAYREWLPAE